MNYFRLPQTSLNAALERIREISETIGLVTGLERSDQDFLKNTVGNVVRNISASVARVKFNSVVEHVAKENKIDPKLVKAIIEKESGFNPDATSGAGAMGLMQLMPGTARQMGVKNPYDPVENIRGGTKYLSSLLNRYHGNVILALSAYNAGPNNVDKYQGVPPFEETKKYVRDVIKKLT